MKPVNKHRPSDFSLGQCPYHTSIQPESIPLPLGTGPGVGEGKMGIDCLKTMDFVFWVKKMFWNLMVVLDVQFKNFLILRKL